MRFVIVGLLAFALGSVFAINKTTIIQESKAIAVRIESLASQEWDGLWKD